MRLKLAPIQKSKWTSTQFVSLREQILTSYRKIRKGVDLGIERERFINACLTIQQVAFTEATDILSIEYHVNEYPELFRTPILELEEYSFIKHDIDDLGGFITTTDIFYGKLNNESIPILKKKNSKFPDFLYLLDDIRFKTNSLTPKIKYAFSKGEPIGSSDKIDRHAKLIKSIHDFVFKTGNASDNNIFVRFAYDDGSVGGEFYLFCLNEITEPVFTVNLHVGLISNRHHELDLIIDYYLIRNSEISKGEDVFISEQEQIAYKKALDFFELLLSRSNIKTIYKINLYHTGLEAAVIGTYRAIIAILSNTNHRGKIIFSPFITQTHKLTDWF
jgi:hypothetical protein